jgi:hypothetical protein
LRSGKSRTVPEPGLLTPPQSAVATPRRSTVRSCATGYGATHEVQNDAAANRPMDKGLFGEGQKARKASSLSDAIG